MKQLLVWGFLGIVTYSGYAYLGVSMTHRSVEGAIENILEHGSHNVPDATLRTKAHTAATSLEIPLEEGQILVSRDRRQGERIVRVEFEYPLEWSYFGSRRTSYRRVDVSRSYPVDEAQEARLASAREARRRYQDDYRERTREARADYKRRLREECTQGNSRDFHTTHVRVTDESTGHSQIVDCGSISHWPD